MFRVHAQAVFGLSHGKNRYVIACASKIYRCRLLQND